ncbi:MAG: STAS domain-containing protein [Crocosphaera sp.]
MTIREIKGDDYSVDYDPDAMIINFKGDLSLEGAKEYKPIAELLENATNNDPLEISLNLRELAFLNSSGISMISKFVLSLRKKKNIQLVVLGSSEIPWQGKSLKNLKKLLPGLKLEVE